MKIIASSLSAFVLTGVAAQVLADTGEPENREIAGSGHLLSATETSAQGSSQRTGLNEASVTPREKRTLEEIIVTAQKREERLQEVPISISVLGEEALERGAIESLKDALKTVPGITGHENQQAGMQRYTVRGVGANTSLYNGSSVIGFYLEEIPFSFVRFPVLPDANAYDLERVEVLRGPQGTLYGASSLNGVVRVLTKDADLENFEARGRTTFSDTKDGDQGYRGDLALNMPLIPGKLALRAVGGYSDIGGWVDYPALGREDHNGGTHKNLRLKLNAAPSENLGIELLTWLSRDKRGAPNGSFDDRTLDWDDPTPLANEFDAHGLTLTYDFAAFTLLSATSHVDYESQSYFDFPNNVLNDNISTALSAKLFAQEIRLSSTASGPWKWSLGAMYRDAEDRRVEEFIKHVVFPGVGDSIFASESTAVYGELTRAFFDDRLEIMGGLRYFRDKSSSNELSNFQLVTPFGKKESTFDRVTPRVVASYRPNNLLNVYASYSQGFRSGFTLAGEVLRITGVPYTSVDPDHLNNYEVGMKGSTKDGMLSYDVAVYYMDWQDTIQVIGTPIAGGNATVNAAKNASGASGPGVDVTTTVRLSPRFDVSAAVSWNDLTLDDDIISFGVVRQEKGSRLQLSPELTANGTLNYTLGIAGDYSTRFSASVEHTSRLTSPTVVGPVEGGDSTQVGAGVSLMSPHGWTATLFGQNLTDEDARVLPGSTIRTFSDHLRPRTIGLQVDFDF